MVICFPDGTWRDITLGDIREWLASLEPSTPVHALCGFRCVVERFMDQEGVENFHIGLADEYVYYETASGEWLSVGEELNKALSTWDQAWLGASRLEPKVSLTAQQALAMLD